MQVKGRFCKRSRSKKRKQTTMGNSDPLRKTNALTVNAAAINPLYQTFSGHVIIVQTR